MQKGVKNMELRERVKAFIDDTGARITTFCKKISISPQYYYQWINNEVEFSSEIANRITTYLNEVYAK